MLASGSGKELQPPIRELRLRHVLPGGRSTPLLPPSHPHLLFLLHPISHPFFTAPKPSHQAFLFSVPSLRPPPKYYYCSIHSPP